MGNRVVSGEWRAQQLKLPKELESRKGPFIEKLRACVVESCRICLVTVLIFAKNAEAEV